MNEPKNPEQLMEKLKPAVGALSVMPPEMWHLWAIWVLEKLGEYVENEREYEEFLERVRVSVGHRVDRGSW